MADGYAEPRKAEGCKKPGRDVPKIKLAFAGIQKILHFELSGNDIEVPGKSQ